MLRLISFDLDDTLYDNKPIIEAAEKDFIDAFSLLFDRYQQSFEESLWLTAKKSVQQKDPIASENMTELRRRAINSLLHFITDKTERINQTEILIRRFIEQRSKVKSPPLIKQFLNALSQQYKLVAITNGNVDFAQTELTPYFQAFYSASLNFRAKPNPQMLEQVAVDFELKPDEWIHIGDSLDSDGEAASRAGIRFIHFAPFTKGTDVQQEIELLKEKINGL